jgi:antitoxin component YwqK of YwqJK toxin-antitoxin module
MLRLERIGPCWTLGLLVGFAIGCSKDAPAPSGATGTPQGAPAGEPALASKRVGHREETPKDAKPGELVAVKEFYEDGSLYTERTERVVAERQRVRVGPMRVLWENGKPRIEGAYDDQGRLTGRWRYFFETGALEREGDFETGKHSGVWVENWPNGKPRFEGFYHVGLREGFWRTWHENGAPESEGEYVNNLRTGPWKVWMADGRPDPALSGEYSANVKID